MKKLLLAAALFIASDAAFASSSVLSGNNTGAGTAFGFGHRPVVVVEPPVLTPTRATNSRREHKPAQNQGSVMALLFRLYLSFAR